jgi:preprotein translocase subunit SecF
MEFFKPGVTYDFFKYRWPFIGTSLALCALSLASLFWPGPKFGIDFKGGTEVELAFKGDVSSSQLRNEVIELGFKQPEVIALQDRKNHYILRLEEISSLPEQKVAEAKKALEADFGADKVVELDASPGGDKLALQLSEAGDTAKIEQALTRAGLKVRAVAAFGRPEDLRYEAQLVGVGDKLVQGLKEKFADKAPEKPLRVEWVGPKAGAQLKDAALKSILYAVAFIVVYVAFRFDLRFAPGGVIALAHDALITLGIYVVLQKEVTLGTIAAVLTVIGFSINDTIVVYDRIRENMARMRDASLTQIINISTSQTLGRTVITSSVALISVLGFFVWGTPLIRDIVFALTCGFLVGTYSSIYVAAPLTEWMDRRFFRKA